MRIMRTTQRKKMRPIASESLPALELSWTPLGTAVDLPGYIKTNAGSEFLLRNYLLRCDSEPRVFHIGWTMQCMYCTSSHIFFYYH